jgi:hypothetical protein
MWDQQPATDLDLHVVVPGEPEIYHGHKRSGGGYLDVDMLANAPKPVENVFFNDLVPGQYKCFVRNYSGCDSKDFKVVMRTNVPITNPTPGDTSGNVLTGMKVVEGTCNGVGASSDVSVFEFNFQEADRAAGLLLQKQMAERNALKVVDTLKRMPQLKFVLIDSRPISGWCPESTMWPTFEKNTQLLCDACGEDQGHHLSAANAEDVASRFQEVADQSIRLTYSVICTFVQIK